MKKLTKSVVRNTVIVLRSLNFLHLDSLWELMWTFKPHESTAFQQGNFFHCLYSAFQNCGWTWAFVKARAAFQCSDEFPRNISANQRPQVYSSNLPLCLLGYVRSNKGIVTLKDMLWEAVEEYSEEIRNTTWSIWQNDPVEAHQYHGGAVGLQDEGPNFASAPAFAASRLSVYPFPCHPSGQ